MNTTYEIKKGRIFTNTGADTKTDLRRTIETIVTSKAFLAGKAKASTLEALRFFPMAS